MHLFYIFKHLLFYTQRQPATSKQDFSQMHFLAFNMVLYGISIDGDLTSHNLVFGALWPRVWGRSGHKYKPYHKVIDLKCDIYPWTWPNYNFF